VNPDVLPAAPAVHLGFQVTVTGAAYLAAR
jgi:hypothetical protein